MAKTFIVRDETHPLFGQRIRNNNGLPLKSVKNKYTEPSKPTNASFFLQSNVKSDDHKRNAVRTIQRLGKALSKNPGHVGLKEQFDKSVGTL